MKNRLISAILLLTSILCLSACGNKGKDALTSSKFNKADLYGQYIDINSGKTLEISDERVEFISADKSSASSTDWTLEGNTVMISRIEPFEIKAEKNGFKLIAKDNSEYASKGDEYVSYSLYYDSLPKFNLGEEAKTDSVKFTLREIEYADLVDFSTLEIKKSGSGYVPPNDDMVFAYLTYSLENISKEEIDIVDDVILTIDYSNGYRYGTSEGESCYFVEVGEYGTRSGTANGPGSGYELSLSSLTSGEYNVAIPCAGAIKEDSQKSLNIIVTITTSDGVEGFIYKIR